MDSGYEFPFCDDRARHLLGALACAALLSGAARAEDAPKGSFRTEVAEIRLEAREGLVFHPARAKAKAGSRLEIYLDNRDPNDMPHNVCLVAPGMLAEIQEASLAIDSGAEARGFVPDHPAVLAHSSLIGAGESAHFSFELPEDSRDVYYLVCTFPGHATVMYTPLYAGLNPRFDLAEDEEVSPLVRQKEKNRIAALEEVVRPTVLRAIMEDTGPASILVALPGEINYCWDATTCRLRYAWKGAFANPLPHFDGNGSKHPEILGEEFWRSVSGETVRGIHPLGEKGPLPDFLGYDLEEGIPTFRYRVAGTEIHERLTADEGALRWTFRVVGSSNEKEEWQVLAPERKTAVIAAPGAQRKDRGLVFSTSDKEPMEIVIRPQLP